jgi:hypothetical protein
MRMISRPIETMHDTNAVTFQQKNRQKRKGPQLSDPFHCTKHCCVRLCYPTSSDPSESYLRSHGGKYTNEILNWRK